MDEFRPPPPTITDGSAAPNRIRRRPTLVSDESSFLGMPPKMTKLECRKVPWMMARSYFGYTAVVSATPAWLGLYTDPFPMD